MEKENKVVIKHLGDHAKLLDSIEKGITSLSNYYTGDSKSQLGVVAQGIEKQYKNQIVIVARFFSYIQDQIQKGTKSLFVKSVNTIVKTSRFITEFTKGKFKLFKDRIVKSITGVWNRFTTKHNILGGGIKFIFTKQVNFFKNAWLNFTQTEAVQKFKEAFNEAKYYILSEIEEILGPDIMKAVNLGKAMLKVVWNTVKGFGRSILKTFGFEMETVEVPLSATAKQLNEETKKLVDIENAIKGGASPFMAQTNAIKKQEESEEEKHKFKLSEKISSILKMFKWTRDDAKKAELRQKKSWLDTLKKFGANLSSGGGFITSILGGLVAPLIWKVLTAPFRMIKNAGKKVTTWIKNKFKRVPTTEVGKTSAWWGGQDKVASEKGGTLTKSGAKKTGKLSKIGNWFKKIGKFGKIGNVLGKIGKVGRFAGMLGLGALGAVLSPLLTALAIGATIYSGFKGWNDTELNKIFGGTGVLSKVGSAVSSIVADFSMGLVSSEQVAKGLVWAGDKISSGWKSITDWADTRDWSPFKKIGEMFSNGLKWVGDKLYSLLPDYFKGAINYFFGRKATPISSPKQVISGKDFNINNTPEQTMKGSPYKNQLSTFTDTKSFLNIPSGVETKPLRKNYQNASDYLSGKLFSGMEQPERSLSEYQWSPDKKQFTSGVDLLVNGIPVSKGDLVSSPINNATKVENAEDASARAKSNAERKEIEDMSRTIKESSGGNKPVIPLKPAVNINKNEVNTKDIPIVMPFGMALIGNLGA